MSKTIVCPDPTCRAPARMVDRWTWASTTGPVEHVKTSCEQGHWFTLTVNCSTRDRRPRRPSRRRCPFWSTDRRRRPAAGATVDLDRLRWRLGGALGAAGRAARRPGRAVGPGKADQRNLLQQWSRCAVLVRH